jgi:hypothetical protein
MIKGVVLISYGMGGSNIETWQSGQRQLVQRCKAEGLDTFASPYNWNQVNDIVAIIDRVPVGIPIAVGGDSLGDNEAPDVAQRTKRTIKYLFGFQKSLYGADIGVPDNVEFADNIMNPGIIGFIRTLGMGSGKWWRTHPRADDEQTGRLRNIPIYASHPGDWGIAQDIIFSGIHKRLLSPPPVMTAPQTPQAK